jgi:hypothetical protein
MVWLITVAVVLLIYLFYILLVGSPDIQIDRDAESDVDIEVPQFGAQTGETKVGNVEKARFTVLDQKTKKLKRVWGFEKLLNPDQEDEKWKLQGPYMDIYDEKFFCQIESDRGKVQVETIAGENEVTNAELYDNVVIKVQPVGQSKIVESTIYLDSLVYNSERSEYSTNGPVKIISQEGTLEGAGLLLIYHNELTRIEFLRIFELDYLKLNNISRISSPASQTSRSSADARVKPQVPSDQLKPSKTAAQDVKPTASSSAQQPDEIDLYNCQFNEKVVIEYGDELVVTGAEHIAVDNILWSESSEDKKAEEDPAVTDASRDVSSNIQTQAHSQTKTDVTVQPSQQNATEVNVTCQGGLILKPKDSLIKTNATADFVRAGLRDRAGSGLVKNGKGKTDLYAKYTSRMTLDPDVPEDDAPEISPSLYGAEGIDYDMTTGNAIAAGPVKFKFYSKDDSDNEFSNGPVPSLITADKNTEFFADADRTVNRIVFNGDVVGARNTRTPVYLQKNSFFGQQLIVDLKPPQDSAGTQIEHVTVKDGNVKLESERLSRGVTINHVRLTGTQIDYSVDDDTVMATGPGDIQINNEHAPTLGKDTGEKLSLKRPCFALIYGYDKLHWFIPENRITADGKANSIRTTGGIHYEEQGGYEFIGDKLFYNVADSLMKISGSDQRPAFANGAKVPAIEYNLQTGKIKTKLSGPGAISFPSRKK